MVNELYKALAIPSNSIARAIAYAIEQPSDVDINEIVVRPTAQDF
jgi:NADP-dependent 3-hydroxy acid dehydrogenase YdfG